MADAILVDLGDIIERHPWWLARGELLLKLLRRAGHQDPCRIIDVGCGWGTNLSLLESAGYAVSGLDISRGVLERLDRPERDLIEADLSQDLPAVVPEYDVVLALDVIERVAFLSRDVRIGSIQRLALRQVGVKLGQQRQTGVVGCAQWLGIHHGVEMRHR